MGQVRKRRKRARSLAVGQKEDHMNMKCAGSCDRIGGEYARQIHRLQSGKDGRIEARDRKVQRRFIWQAQFAGEGTPSIAGFERDEQGWEAIIHSQRCQLVAHGGTGGICAGHGTGDEAQGPEQVFH